MSRVASCKHPVTFVPLLAPNPGDATGFLHSFSDTLIMVFYQTNCSERCMRKDA